MPLSDAEMVARCPLFAQLPDEDVVALAGVGVRRPVAAGETLFLAGERARGLPLVVRGRVKIYVLSPTSGREVVLTIERPFGAVAELVAFDGGPYPASAEAMEDGELLWLDQEGLQSLVRSRPALAVHLVRTLGRRLRRLVGLIERISFQEVIQRLAADLLEAAEHGVPFALDTNAAIAARLGTVPELVSRNLSRLHQSGMLELRGRTVLSLDRGALGDLAARAGALSLGALAAVIVLAAGGPWSVALALWLVAAGRNVPSVLYVRARLRLQRGGAARRGPVLAAHAAASVAVAGACVAGALPWLALGAFAVLSARAVAGTRPSTPVLAAKSVGMLEMAFGLSTVAAVLLGVWAGL